jgi:hypothetical protein
MHAGVWVALAALLVTDVDDAVRDGDRGACVQIHRQSIGHVVGIADLADVHLALAGAPTTAVLEKRRSPSPDRNLPGGLRITTRCDQGCCVDGLAADGKALIAAELDGDDRRACRGGWVDRVVRVAFQDRAAVSVYVGRSWFVNGAAHANNQLVCRSFDRASGRPLKLGDVLSGAEARRVLDQTRRTLRGSEFAGFTPNAAGIRFQPAPARGRDVQLCAEGPYPAKSDQIVEIDAHRP